MDGHNHYIRLEGNKVIKGFSDAFEEPQEGDVLIAENTDQRHFFVNGIINPALTDEQGIAKYKYVDGEVVARSEQEIEADRPAPVPVINIIELSADKVSITADGIDKATVTATFSGEVVDSFNCYIVIDGVVCDTEYPIVGGEVAREFTSETAKVYKIDFHAGDKMKTIFVEAV